MLQPYRDQFNAQFTPAKYAELLARLTQLARTPIEFRVAETPCFFPQSLLNKLAETGATLTHQLLDNPAYLPAFHVYEDKLHIATVDIAKLQKRGNRLFYQRDGRDIPIHRIYNRAIVDELQRKNIQLPFDYRDPLEVEWAGHPNWYFRISKFSLPFLNHPSVPKAVFLEDWFAKRNLEGLPDQRENLLLKPLYSFAGKGIQFAPTDQDLNSIPPADRHLYLLQERVAFKPTTQTPHVPTQAEIRIMYLWPDGGSLQ